MDETKEPQVTDENSGASEKIEVKVASSSTEPTKLSDVNTVSGTEPVEAGENGGSSAQVDELVPPPEAASDVDSLDEGALEGPVPVSVNEGSEMAPQILAPVVAPPEDMSYQASPQADQSAGTQLAEPTTVTAQQVNSVHPHRNNKKLAIVITLFVGALLAFVAVYVYMSANENTKEVTPAPIPRATQNTDRDDQPDTKPATNEDIDAATKDLEDALNSLDDASDLPEDQLSDEVLGL